MTGLCRGQRSFYRYRDQWTERIPKINIILSLGGAFPPKPSHVQQFFSRNSYTCAPAKYTPSTTAGSVCLPETNPPNAPPARCTPSGDCLEVHVGDEITIARLIHQQLCNGPRERGGRDVRLGRSGRDGPGGVSAVGAKRKARRARVEMVADSVSLAGESGGGSGRGERERERESVGLVTDTCLCF